MSEPRDDTNEDDSDDALVAKFDQMYASFEIETFRNLGFSVESIRGDWYDMSIELDGVPPDQRMSAEQQKYLHGIGFLTAYVNHTDGWETHYNFKPSEPFQMYRGWRRRYVQDPHVTTTNVIAGPPSPGYFEISYWPDSWKGNEEWLKTGFMRIVPDPMENKRG